MCTKLIESKYELYSKEEQDKELVKLQNEKKLLLAFSLISPLLAVVLTFFEKSFVSFFILSAPFIALLNETDRKIRVLRKIKNNH